MALLGFLRDNARATPPFAILPEGRERGFTQVHNVLCARLHAVRGDRPQARR